MENLFVPYSIALLAKEKGFNEQCLAYYVNKTLKICKDGMLGNTNIGFMGASFKGEYYSAPLYQQLVDWAYIEGKLLYYRPDNRELMNLEIKEWLESIK